MDNCQKDKCKCERACFVLNRCVFSHHLVEDHQDEIERLLQQIGGEKDKTRALLNFFHKQSPPKYKIKPLLLQGRKGMVKRFQKALGRHVMSRLHQTMDKGRTMAEITEIKKDFYKLIEKTGNSLNE